MQELARVFATPASPTSWRCVATGPTALRRPAAWACRTPRIWSRSCARTGSPRSASRLFPEGIRSPASLCGAVENLKRKADAGATRAITEYVFDNAVYLRFVTGRAAGIEIPIVPGILPIAD